MNTDQEDNSFSKQVGIRSVFLVVIFSILVISGLSVQVIYGDTVGSTTTLNIQDETVITTMPSSVNGTTTSLLGVDDVYMYMKRVSDGAWLQNDGSFAVNFNRVPVALNNGGAQSVSWTLTIDLPNDRYGFDVVSYDMSRTRNTRDWRNFDVDINSPADQPPLAVTYVLNNEVFEVSQLDIDGSATDDVSVVQVDVAIRDRVNKTWLQPDGSFGPTYKRIVTTLSNPGSTSTDWQFTGSLPEGQYGFHPIAVDTLGQITQPSDRVWRRFDVVAGSPSTSGYLTIQFGRTQWGLSHTSNCILDPRSFTLDLVAEFLTPLGFFSQGTTAIGQMSQDPSVRNCPFTVQQTASWDDLAYLRDNHGWTFIGDSQGIYDSDGNLIEDRPRFSKISAEEQERQSCGSLQVLESYGHTRGWGLYSYPGNNTDRTAHENIVLNCYSYGRKYSGSTNTESSLIYPYWATTQSVNGGYCNDVDADCYDFASFDPGWGANNWNLNNRRYVPRYQLLAQMSPGPGAWKITQFYRLVEGQRLPGPNESPDDNHYWDCTSPDSDLHWTSQGEIYCADDFRWVVQNLPSHIVSVDAADIAEMWGRGNPNSLP